MNVIYYDNETKEKVFEALNKSVKEKVDTMAYLEVEDWSNKVFVMAKDSNHKPDVTEFIDNAKTLENILKAWKVQNRGGWMKDMGMADHLINFKKIEV